MARRPKRKYGRRRRQRLEYLQVDMTHAAGTTAARDVSASIHPTPFLDPGVWAIRTKLLWSTNNFTVGQGPIEVGICHADYSAAEIEECLEAQGAWKESDKIEQEKARRLVRRVGVFPLRSSGEALNQGMPVYTTLNFKIEEGATITLWMKNLSTTEGLTTGGIVSINGTMTCRRIGS